MIQDKPAAPAPVHLTSASGNEYVKDGKQIDINGDKIMMGTGAIPKGLMTIENEQHKTELMVTDGKKIQTISDPKVIEAALAAVRGIMADGKITAIEDQKMGTMIDSLVNNRSMPNQSAAKDGPSR